jgi:enoyl-CoA hydratase/carnithine racemase
MSDEPVGVQRRGRVLVLTLDRPARMNALSAATVRALGDVGRGIASDAELRAIVITGAGDKAFCAGADLKERREMTDAAVRAELLAYQSELGWLDRSPLPVIAAINGAALGGGLELALMCDLRVAAPHATFALPETSLGIIPAAGGTQRLPRLIGEARAKELILLGTRLDAPAALSFGLINRISQPGQAVLEDALQWIEPIANGAPIAQRAALAAIAAAAELELEPGLERERELYEQTLASRDRREALEAFAEKRKPVFKGE